MRQIKIYILSIVLAANAFSQQNQPLYPDIRILESDERGMTIEYLPIFLPNEKINSESFEMELPQFRYSTLTQQEKGREDIRYRLVQFSLPGRQGNSVTVIAADYETVNNFSFAVVPEIQLIDNLGATKKTYSANTSTSADFYPQHIAQMNRIGSMRGWIFGNLLITPFQYQSTTKTLKKYSRIVVRVDYGKKEQPLIADVSDELAKILFINYPSAKNWIETQRFAKTTAVNSFMSTGKWIKLEVSEDGMYKIDAAFLKSVGIELTELNAITDIKIFGADGRNLAENLATPRPADIPQLAVSYIDKNNNTKFDNDDYLIFFGQGITGWNYNSEKKEFLHYYNPYTNSNYYFLTANVKNVSTKQVGKTLITPNTTAKISRAVGKVFFDEEKINFIQSGQNWVSAPFNPKESRVISNKLWGWIPKTSVHYSYKLYGRSNVDATFTMEEAGKVVKVESIQSQKSDQLSGPEGRYGTDNTNSFTAIPDLVDSRSNLKLTYDANSNVANGWIDWIEIFYQQELSGINNNELIFNSPDSSGVVEYELSNFTTFTPEEGSVFDVTDVVNVRSLSIKLDQLSGNFSFKDTLSSSRVKKYWIGTSANYKTPRSIGKISNSNLHGFTGAQFIIITNSELKSEANRLKLHKENLPVKNKLSTVVVDIDSLYNEFGIGMSDPTSMRDFLYYATNNWGIKPKYVLFFGDASYDYKGILKNDRNVVPTLETSESNERIYSYAYDDYFSYLNPLLPDNVSIAHGRLCARSAAEAKLLVDRIIQYETNPTKSIWKNTITLVADDNLTNEGNEGNFSGEQTETLSKPPFTPQSFEIKKIYESDYPTTITSSGRRKPEVRQDILDQVNRYGTLVLNYAGHGNPKVWSHESILTIDDVKNQFTNSDKLTFVVAATCDWGRFDEAGEQSSGELIMVNTNGGAIGVLSAVRAVYAQDNANTNQSFYFYLLRYSPAMRFGDAYMAMKNNVSSDLTNKKKYHLFGDPTLRLAIPEVVTQIDSINGKSVLQLDTLRALQKVTMKATVKDSSGNLDGSYNGTALVTIYDSERLRDLTDIGFTYIQNGSVLYKGENSIKNGRMEATFIVPKDISYENKNGRISVYFSNVTSDGRGFTKNIIIGGTSQSSSSDLAGPDVKIFFDNSSFRSGDLVGNNPVLIVNLKDSSGINSASSSIGHRIEAWVDGNAKSVDLTDLYKGKIDNFQEGAVEYQMENIIPGNHTIKVRAWDVYNNSSTTEAMFVVTSSTKLTIDQVYNFPNPVSSVTAFTFQHNQLMPVDVDIKIFTVTGRLIHTITRTSVMDRFVKIDWNRRDTDGDRVGNGIYFYKVIVKTIDGKYSSEAIGKMAVVE